jgi:hypothetical protein
MSLIRSTKCEGCGAALGELHAPTCPRATCWHCGQEYAGCPWKQSGLQRQFPSAGDLEDVFANQNRHYVGLDLDEFDFMPTYEGGKLVGLRSNRVGPGPWRVIETSAQARDLRDLTLAMPHLSMENCDDCVEALLHSPLLSRLQILQLGETDRGWDANLDDEGALCDGEDMEALVALVERMPRVVALYLAAAVPEPGLLLAATFPPALKTLQARSFEPLDLGVLARNDSLGGLGTLVLRKEPIGARVGEGFYAQLGALLNRAALDRLQDLRLDVPELDDVSCEILVGSRLVRQLRRLWLRGEGVTDAGAAILAACPDIQKLEELAIEGPDVTEAGYAALRAAGVRLRDVEE